MGIWERLGTVVKSYLNDDESGTFEKSTSRSSIDPDLNAAYDELNDFLKGKENREKHEKKEPQKKVPEELCKYFTELGLPPGSSMDECKIAYKKLLKLHHPDRHAGESEKIKKATEKSALLNTAYDQIEKWYRE
ncbi:MAG: J domain-containing protein [Treponema sp.]|nr:J domain-containing protein [Treponema sp.]